MVSLILIGVILFLYLAGYLVFKEYMEVLERQAIEEEEPLMPELWMSILNWTWPLQVVVSCIRKHDDE